MGGKMEGMGRCQESRLLPADLPAQAAGGERGLQAAASLTQVTAAHVESTAAERPSSFPMWRRLSARSFALAYAAQV